MAATNDLQIKRAAAATTVIDLTADLTNTNIAGGTTILDNSADKYPRAQATFNNPGTFSAAPSAGACVNLWMVRQDTDSTNDDTSAPSGTDPKAAECVGSFPIYATDEEQRVTIDIDLRGALAAKFFIENKTGVTIAGTGSHIYVKIQPYTFAPAA
jgi:hypothetical protein